MYKCEPGFEPSTYETIASMPDWTMLMISATKAGYLRIAYINKKIKQKCSMLVFLVWKLDSKKVRYSNKTVFPMFTLEIYLIKRVY